MNHLYFSREIAAACLRDINFMWLLEGAVGKEIVPFGVAYFMKLPFKIG